MLQADSFLHNKMIPFSICGSLLPPPVETVYFTGSNNNTHNHAHVVNSGFGLQIQEQQQ